MVASQRPLTVGAGDEGGPRFASGQLVVFWRTEPELNVEVGSSNAREVWLINVTTGVESRVTSNKVEDVFPDASPCGKYFSFTKRRDWIHADRVTSKTTKVGEGSDGTFSPDGKQIAVVAGKFGRRIDTMNIDGSGRQTIYSRNTTVSHPALSPRWERCAILGAT